MSMFDKRKDNDPESQPEAAGPPPAARPKMGEVISAAREIAVLGRTITVKGDVTGTESLVIDGRVEGSVLLDGHDLTVGQSGAVTASVKAKVVRIEGQVTGDIDGKEKVVVTKTGRVEGNIVAPRVTLEDGAKFKGSIDMDPASGADTKPREVARPAPAATSSGKADQPAGDSRPS